MEENNFENLKNTFFNFFDYFSLETKYVVILIIGLIFLFFFIFLLIKNKKPNSEIKKHIKPSVEDLVSDEKKSNINSLKNNDYVDVLVTIEEEMAAIRELYVGGYITKGIYISETDRLY